MELWGCWERPAELLLPGDEDCYERVNVLTTEFAEAVRPSKDAIYLQLYQQKKS